MLYIKQAYIALRNYYYYLHRKPYIPIIREYLGNDVSIISSNCFAGRIIQDLGKEYNTPTVGLYFMYPDYIEFLQNLHHYLTCAEINFVSQSKYPIGNERHLKWKYLYPIGLLDGKVEIHFLHYKTKEEAASKWNRRCRRINWEKLLIIGMEQNCCQYKDLQRFDELPYQHKYIFTSKITPFNSNIYIPEFKKEGEVGDPYRKGDLFYRYLVERLRKDMF